MTRGAETKQQTARRFAGRLTLVGVFFSLLAVSLVARAVHLQVFNKDFLNQQADTRHLRTERITAHRGMITDRNGEPLAISTPVDSIWANPKELAPAVDRVPQLARLLGIDPQQLIRRVTRSMDKEFLYLKRHLSPEQAQLVLDLKLPGVNVQREYRSIIGLRVSRGPNAYSRIGWVAPSRMSKAFVRHITARICRQASISGFNTLPTGH